MSDDTGQGALLFSYGSDDTFTWHHLDAAHNQADGTLRAVAPGIPDEVQGALLAGETRPRFTRFGSGFLLNLRGVNLNDNSEPEDMVSIRIWCDGNNLVSTRRRRLKAVDDIRNTILEGEAPETAMDFIVQFVERLNARMEPVIGALDDEMDAYEADGLVGDPDAIPDRHLYRNVTMSARRALVIRRYMIPQKAALAGMLEQSALELTDEQRIGLSESINRITLFSENLEEARERASLLRSELDHQATVRMNKHTNLLSIVAAIFLPLSFATGLFGMNVGGMPGIESDIAFWSLTIGMGTLALVLWVLFYIKRWF